MFSLLFLVNFTISDINAQLKSHIIIIIFFIFIFNALIIENPLQIQIKTNIFPKKDKEYKTKESLEKK